VSVDSSRAPLKLPQAPAKYTKINRDVAVEERESGHCGQVRQTLQGKIDSEGYPSHMLPIAAV